MLFGDDLIDSKVPCLKQMVKVFERYGDPVIALEEVAKKEVSSYGVVAATSVDNKIYEIKNIVEKPAVKDAPSNLAIVGKYIITKNVFDELRKLRSTREQRERSSRRMTAARGEIHLSDALKNVLRRQAVYGYRFDGRRYDCGSKIGFLKAIVDFGLKHEETKKEFRKYLERKFSGDRASAR